MVASLKELKSAGSKGRDSHFTLWNKYVCSHFSVYITKIILYTPITANHVTMMMVTLGIIGPVFLFYGSFVAGLVMLHLAVLLDNVDGEVARAKNQKSMMGKYLDSFHHVTASPLMLFGYAFGVYMIHPDIKLIIFGFLAASFSKSIVLPVIFDTIVTMRVRGVHPPIHSKTDGSEVKEIEGLADSYKSPLLKVYSIAKEFWEYPFNLVALTILFILENSGRTFISNQPYVLTVWFFVIYGTFMALNQLASFALHTKRNSIESFYVFLFGRK